jgi:hypothetical protein
MILLDNSMTRVKDHALLKKMVNYLKTEEGHQRVTFSHAKFINNR